MFLEFRKRQAASMINVLVFFLMAMTVASQTFFFSATSMEATAVQTETAARRLAYGRYLHEALETIRTTTSTTLQRNEADRQLVSYASGTKVCDPDRNPTKTFFEQRKTNYYKTGNNLCYEIYDLNYTLVHAKMNYESLEKVTDPALLTSWETQLGTRFFDKLNQMIFPAMGENYYLIRVYEKYTDKDTDRQKLRGQRLMYQVVARKNDSNTPSVISFQEVWY